jgi:uncharacterized protein
MGLESLVTYEPTFELLLQAVSELTKRDSSGHDIQHTLRVYEMCKKLGREEGADMEVLLASALLHDIAISEELELGVDHAEESALRAEGILRSIGFPEDKLSRVICAIRAHRYGAGIKPESLEAKILQDADRLDAMGAVGLARAFAYGGARGAKIYDPLESPGEYDPRAVKSTITHLQEKLLKLKDSMNTSSAKRLAEGRHSFMVEFLNRFLAEVRGEL